MYQRQGSPILGRDHITSEVIKGLRQKVLRLTQIPSRYFLSWLRMVVLIVVLVGCFN